LMIETAATSVGGGVDAYWRLEKLIRAAESKVDSSIGCTGAVYAIRRNLFHPIPADTLLDDVVIPMQIALQNYRIAFEPGAIAFDPQSLEPERERIRKQRTLAGNFQMLFRNAGWLLPWRNRLWWQLISHKYFRLGGPLFLLVLFVSNVMLIEKPFYRYLLIGQCLFYLFALCGTLFKARKFFCFSAPAGFVFLNLMTIRGFFYFIGGGFQTGWRTTDQVLNPR
jgi:cellulose synthase/poly-beta-1,6-N-acetylglucosamine synthase-like glycosyltransferase